MTDTQPIKKINSVPYLTRRDRLAEAVGTPEFAARLRDSRAVLAGIRQEKDEEMTYDQTYTNPAQPAPRRPWYRRPAWQVGGAAVAGSLVLCCGVSVVAGVAGDNGDSTAPRPAQTAARHTDAPVSSEPTATGSPAARVKPAYILEITGPGTADITFFTGRTSATVTGAKLPWRKEVSSSENFTSVTAFVQKATAAKPVSCKITERFEDGDTKVHATGSSEPGDFVTVSCDKLF